MCANSENSTKYSIQGANDEIMYRTNDLGGQVMEVNLLYSFIIEEVYAFSKSSFYYLQC